MLPVTICCDISNKTVVCFGANLALVRVVFARFEFFFYPVCLYFNYLPQEVKSKCKFIDLNLQPVKHRRYYCKFS